MRRWIRLVPVFLILIGGPVIRADDGWSWKPFEMKRSISPSGEDSAQLDWGAEYDFESGIIRVSASGEWPDENTRIQLDLSRESEVWEFAVRGILDQDENYRTPTAEVGLQWENAGYFVGTSFTSLRRTPSDPDNRYTYMGWESQLNGGYRWKNGQTLRWGINHKDLDYPDYTNSSSKTDLTGSFRWKIGHGRCYLAWKEWSYDYPDKPMENSWGRQIGLDWKLPSASKQWSLAWTGSERVFGDGLTSRKNQVNVAETLFLKNGLWSWKLFGAWQSGSSWIEEAYDLAEDSTMDWGLKTEADLGLAVSWQREFGPHRRWKLGGGLERDDGELLSWSWHSELDWYLGDWRMRFYLNLTGKDSQSEAGAWIKMTYYF